VERINPDSILRTYRREPILSNIAQRCAYVAGTEEVNLGCFVVEAVVGIGPVIEGDSSISARLRKIHHIVEKASDTRLAKHFLNNENVGVHCLNDSAKERISYC